MSSPLLILIIYVDLDLVVRLILQLTHVERLDVGFGLVLAMSKYSITIVDLDLVIKLILQLSFKKVLMLVLGLIPRIICPVRANFVLLIAPRNQVKYHDLTRSWSYDFARPKQPTHMLMLLILKPEQDYIQAIQARFEPI